ncbi:MAG: putative DNA binding domain-containing protein [Chloroflexi bacterium]|nr:putative DNA binding domain-containing protein [Chloroflexota bacterium]
MSRYKKNKGVAKPQEKATWRRIDLHIHTPASKDYQESGVTYLDILHKAEAEGLDIIAFTDHNTVAGYAAMMQEVEDLTRWEQSGRLRPEEKARLDEYRRLFDKILVLPGMELTATFGFHILGIFDPSTPIRTLEHVLLDLHVPAALLDAGETEVGPTVDVLRAYEIMDEAGALVIAAHANSTHGVAMFGFDFGGQTRIAYTQDPHLHALEVTDLESKRRRTTASFFNGSKPQYPRRMHCIQGSDAHRVKGKGKDLGVGERATEVLLSEVSFKALKEVFLGDDFTRTRPYRRSEEPFDHVEAARQQGPTIVQSFHENITRRGGCLNRILCDVVAFANTNGGTIYVGVSSQARVPPKGIDNPEEAMATLRAEIERAVTPPIPVELSVLKSRGKNVIRIAVPKGEEVPYVLDGSHVYVRRESETSLALRDEIVALVARARARAAAQKAPSPEEATVPAEEEATSAQASETPPGVVEAPRTGVEIDETVVRKGVKYHTMRDLRDGTKVHNVTRASARRLWRYAIALKEKGAFQEDKVKWTGDLGLWHKYLRSGRPHYDLVQRMPDGAIRIYYGVSEDGIHGPWKDVVNLRD